MQLRELRLGVRLVAFAQPAGDDQLGGCHGRHLLEPNERVDQHMESLFGGQPCQVAHTRAIERLSGHSHVGPCLAIVGRVDTQRNEAELGPIDGQVIRHELGVIAAVDKKCVDVFRQASNLLERLLLVRRRQFVQEDVVALECDGDFPPRTRLMSGTQPATSAFVSTSRSGCGSRVSHWQRRRTSLRWNPAEPRSIESVSSPSWAALVSTPRDPTHRSRRGLSSKRSQNLGR